MQCMYTGHVRSWATAGLHRNSLWCRPGASRHRSANPSLPSHKLALAPIIYDIYIYIYMYTWYKYTMRWLLPSLCSVPRQLLSCEAHASSPMHLRPQREAHALVVRHMYVLIIYIYIIYHLLYIISCIFDIICIYYLISSL